MSDETNPSEGSACSISPEAMRKSLQEAYEREAAKYQRIINIGNMTFGETEAPEHPMTSLSKQAAIGTPPGKAVRPGFSKSFDAVTMTLEEARTAMPFAFALPAWVPEGFELTQEVRASLPGEHEVIVRNEIGQVTGTQKMRMPFGTVNISWKDVAGCYLNLHVNNTSPQPEGFPIFPSPIQPGGVTEVRVGDAPAALITGQYVWRIAFRKDEPKDYEKAPELVIGESISLQWTWENVRYSLNTGQNGVAAEDLLRIANSIPKP